MTATTRIGRPPSCTCGECRKCRRAAYMRAWWARKTPEERREAVARRDQERVRRQDRERFHLDPDRRKAIMSRAEAWAGRHPQASKARHAVSNAVRDGRLLPGPCEQASEGDCYGPINAHHDDYARPLDVRWLCRSHHSRFHAEHGSVAEAA